MTPEEVKLIESLTHEIRRHNNALFPIMRALLALSSSVHTLTLHAKFGAKPSEEDKKDWDKQNEEFLKQVNLAIDAMGADRS